MGQGVPAGWETVAQRVAEAFGHTVTLAIAPEAFRSDDSMIEVYLDGKLSGGMEFTWDDGSPRSEVLADLWERVTELLAQELGSGI